MLEIWTKDRTRNLIVGIVAGIAVSVVPALAESWPQRPVRVIAPFAAGAAADVAARLFCDELAKRWKQPLIVENRPGADGLLGTTAFVGMRDDHVLMFSPAAPISYFPVIHERLSYDPAHDIVPISSATNSFAAVAATTLLKVDSITDLVTLARRQPGRLNYTAGSGPFSMLFAGFAKDAGLDMAFVSYREPSLAFQDLVSGRVQVMTTVVTNLLPLAQVGKVHLLAVMNAQRAPVAPDVPTTAEAGYPSLAFEGLTGFFGPRDIPSERRDNIAADIRAVALDQALHDRLAAIGQITRGSTPSEFRAAIEEQTAKLAAIAKSADIKPLQ